MIRKMHNITLNNKQRRELEKALIEFSQVYRWLIEAGVSKNKIRIGLQVRWNKLYEIFRYPFENITLKKLFWINSVLPDKSLIEILTSIAPEYSKDWYELSDIEEEIEEILRTKYK